MTDKHFIRWGFGQYVAKLKDLIDIYYSVNFEEVVKVSITRDGNVFISINFTSAHAINHVPSGYEVRIIEKLQTKVSAEYISALKFSHQIRSELYEDEFYRFDFDPKETRNPHHINVSEKKFMKAHMVYSIDTNVDISKTDAIKSISIFSIYIKEPDICILDDKRNMKYLRILGG